MRRLLALVQGFPDDGALARARDPDFNLHQSWGNREELLAALIEHVSVLGVLMHAAWFKPPHPKPIDIPRPWIPAEATKPRKATAEDMKAMFGGAVHYVPAPTGAR